jgi:hypothetical protein
MADNPQDGHLPWPLSSTRGRAPTPRRTGEPALRMPRARCVPARRRCRRPPRLSLALTGLRSTAPTCDGVAEPRLWLGARANRTARHGHPVSTRGRIDRACQQPAVLLGVDAPVDAGVEITPTPPGRPGADDVQPVGSVPVHDPRRRLPLPHLALRLPPPTAHPRPERAALNCQQLRPEPGAVDGLPGVRDQPPARGDCRRRASPKPGLRSRVHCGSGGSVLVDGAPGGDPALGAAGDRDGVDAVSPE